MAISETQSGGIKYKENLHSYPDTGRRCGVSTLIDFNITTLQDYFLITNQNNGGQHIEERDSAKSLYR